MASLAEWASEMSPLPRGAVSVCSAADACRTRITHLPHCLLISVPSAVRPSRSTNQPSRSIYILELTLVLAPSTAGSPSPMINKTLPYFFEDRSGQYTSSDFDDIYDRLYFRVAPPDHHVTSKDSESTLMVFNTGRRSSSHRDHRPPKRSPSVILDFGPQGALGKISFVGSSIVLPMNQYLKKTSMFGSSLSRRFRASDGEEYRWSYRSIEGQEWSCVDSRNYIVAHYNLKPPEKPVFSTSGNILTIYEAYANISVDILASLTIMRHIATHHL
ncbi:uncharacterized protein FIBRA_05376 [Fibroporia radiculosa]|uniref:DUF6593 domain-containing protein n=1 Tax=Fibroporia radiculosa TaxID=599839 RepID=J4GQW1_9APHY|nr:uncharacterized protein FIBRA_05376 [Fibroporia radiculosa]CCM03250.1 predicted protein [Fibroporia radiculosa]